MSLILPKPVFESCDETSLKLKVHYHLKDGEILSVQCKEPHLEWDSATEFTVRQESNVNLAELVDLKPGTAYSVRLALRNSTGDTLVLGPQVIFDTKPIDCGPKRSCSVS